MMCSGTCSCHLSTCNHWWKWHWVPWLGVVCQGWFVVMRAKQTVCNSLKAHEAVVDRWQVPVHMQRAYGGVGLLQTHVKLVSCMQCFMSKPTLFSTHSPIAPAIGATDLCAVPWQLPLSPAARLHQAAAQVLLRHLPALAALHARKQPTHNSLRTAVCGIPCCAGTRRPSWALLLCVLALCSARPTLT